MEEEKKEGKKEEEIALIAVLVCYGKRDHHHNGYHLVTVLRMGPCKFIIPLTGRSEILVDSHLPFILYVQNKPAQYYKVLCWVIGYRFYREYHNTSIKNINVVHSTVPLCIPFIRTIKKKKKENVVYS